MTSSDEADDEQYCMPRRSPDREPDHPLGKRFTVRMLSENSYYSAGLSEQVWDVEWLDIRENEKLSTLMSGGQAYWHEEGGGWLEPNGTPSSEHVNHGNTIRVVDAPRPSEWVDLRDVVFPGDIEESSES